MQPRPVVSHSQDESSLEESLPKESIDNPKKRKYTGSTAWNNGKSFFSYEEKAVYVLHELLLKSIEEVKRFIGPDGLLNSKYIIQRYIEHYPLNASSKENSTLLHALIALEYYDLAESLIENHQFYKINFIGNCKTMGEGYRVSALELAILHWTYNRVKLDFIHSLLMHGASPPRATIFQLPDHPNRRKLSELPELISLLKVYGFKIEELAKVFDSETYDAIIYQMEEDEETNKIEKILLVEESPERLQNGLTPHIYPTSSRSSCSS